VINKDCIVYYSVLLSFSFFIAALLRRKRKNAAIIQITILKYTNMILSVYTKINAASDKIIVEEYKIARICFMLNPSFSSL
jgi:hypothetical protein